MVAGFSVPCLPASASACHRPPDHVVPRFSTLHSPRSDLSARSGIQSRVSVRPSSSLILVLPSHPCHVQRRVIHFASSRLPGTHWGHFPSSFSSICKIIRSDKVTTFLPDFTTRPCQLILVRQHQPTFSTVNHPNTNRPKLSSTPFYSSQFPHFLL